MTKRADEEADLLDQVDDLARELISEAQGVTLATDDESAGQRVAFKDKVDLLSKLTAYLQVKYRIEGDDGSGKRGNGFDQWRASRGAAKSAGGIHRNRA